MTRATHPTPTEVQETLKRRQYCDYPWDLYHSTRILVRTYDRSSGNFKANGWLVLLQFFQPNYIGTLVRVKTVITDEELVSFRQFDLSEF